MAAKAKRGSPYHKNPDCPCDQCTSRRRQEETIARGNRNNPLATTDPSGNRRFVDGEVPQYIITGTTKRDKVAQYVAWRAQEPGITNQEIAKRLGISRITLTSIIKKATDEGWLKFDEPLSRLEFEVIPKVIDNLTHFLDKKDKTVTIETAKGTVFKDYQKAQGTGEGSQVVLALKIEAIEPENVKITAGQIVGSPKVIEGEVKDA